MNAIRHDFRVFCDRIQPASTPKPRFLDALARRAVLQRLTQLHHGQLTLLEGDHVHCFGETTEDFPVSVVVLVHDPCFYSDIAFGGTIGAGEAYMQGFWSTTELTNLVRIFVRNMDVLEGMERGWAWLTTPLQRSLHCLNRNTRDGSRRNISAHYDLSNDFFRLFLDETLMYSSAIFPHANSTLHEAQLARLDAICRKLDLKSTDHLLEIGTGWGGFALYAATHYGCKVTTTTISREQFSLAVERVANAGLQDRITVLPLDYRDLSGQFDKLVSIEMIEAVGHQYYDEFFAKCSSLLKTDGLMLVQAITIADQRYERAKHSVDFIQRYIFPGSCIPSVTALTNSLTRTTDLRLFDLEDIGLHYATTLKKWRENFFHNLERIKALGLSDAFVRMWEYYFCYCEGGFIERVISDVHMLLAKPLNRRQPKV